MPRAVRRAIGCGGLEPHAILVKVNTLNLRSFERSAARSIRWGKSPPATTSAPPSSRGGRTRAPEESAKLLFSGGFSRRSLGRAPRGVNARRAAGDRSCWRCREWLPAGARRAGAGGDPQASASRISSPPASELPSRCRIPDAAVGGSDASAENCGTSATRKATSLNEKRPVPRAPWLARRGRRAPARSGSAPDRGGGSSAATRTRRPCGCRRG
jgi:hypothetical protein